MITRTYDLRYAHVQRQIVSSSLNWLSSREREEYLRLRNSVNRAGWLTGRALAKRMLLQRETSFLRESLLAGDAGLRDAESTSAASGLISELPFANRPSASPFVDTACEVWSSVTMTESQLARFEVLTRTSRGGRTKPRIRLDGEVSPISLSIAHSDNSVLVALVHDRTESIGVQMVDPNQLPQGEQQDGFLRLWFTPDERKYVDKNSERVALLWAIKSAIHKATNRGERFAPQSIEVLGQHRFRNVIHRCNYRIRSCEHQCRITTARIDNQLVAVVTRQRQFQSQSAVRANPFV